jgi:dTDP-4-dehydrorhamnose 3,5-epimerase
MPADAIDIVEIEVPRCAKGLGDVIIAPAQTGLIDGVRIQPSALYPDDRGWFLEVARLGAGLVAGFSAESTQVSAALSYPHTIKAFHFHRKQTDFWVPVAGMLQVALIDMRPSSPTFGARNTIYAGELRPWQILIPPGVAHGYKVIGRGPALLVYVTDRFYDREDEGRIPYDDDRISYDWETQHK